VLSTRCPSSPQQSLSTLSFIQTTLLQTNYNLSTFNMKVTQAIFSALVAVASVNAAATPLANPSPVEVRDFCFSAGNPCSILKRAAEAVDEVLADPVVRRDASAANFCHLPGEPCAKAKRDASAANFCHLPGEPCAKAKRDLENLFEMAQKF
jgi:hypothetical protein